MCQPFAYLLTKFSHVQGAIRGEKRGKITTFSLFMDLHLEHMACNTLTPYERYLARESAKRLAGAMPNAPIFGNHHGNQLKPLTRQNTWTWLKVLQSLENLARGHSRCLTWKLVYCKILNKILFIWASIKYTSSTVRDTSFLLEDWNPS